MAFRDGRKIYVPDAYSAKNFAQGAAIEMVDAEGHHVQLKRNSARNLEELISPGGHTIRFKYDSADRIVEAKDDAGHLRADTYDKIGHLDSVGDGSHILYRFEYQRLISKRGLDPYLMTTVMDGDWKVLVRNKFLNGRVSEEVLGDRTAYRFDYQFKGAEVIQTTITFPGGEKNVFSFDDGILTDPK